MKKNATIEEKIAAVSKILLKKFKASEDKKEIGILYHFTRVISSKLGEYIAFRGRDGNKEVEINFGNLSESGLGDVSCKIADAIVKKLKLKKGESVERGLKRLKKVLDKEGLLKKLRDQRYFEKPCVKARKKSQRARIRNRSRRGRMELN